MNEGTLLTALIQICVVALVYEAHRVIEALLELRELN